MKFDLIMSDYDGTLGQAPQNDIDFETACAIKKFQDRGGKFVVCSGRSYGSLLSVIDTQGIKCLIAGFQGAYVRESHSNKIILNKGIEGKIASEISAIILGQNLQMIAYSDDVCYYQGDFERINEFISVLSSSSIERVADLVSTLKSKKIVSKLVVVCDVKNSDNTYNAVKNLLSNYPVSTNSAVKGCIEIINPKVDKANAVIEIAKYYDIPFERIMTVGDSDNDISLVGGGKWHGVAVGDGREELKAVAKEVTLPFNEKPILYLIEKYCLND